MKFLKWVYYVVVMVLVILALLLIVSVFPIPGNFKMLVVLSGSMEPKIHTGSVVVIRPAASYKIGDVVTYGAISKTETPVTHRIVEMRAQTGQPVYITKGDANNTNDQKEITNKDIDGKVYFSVPYAGYAVDAVRKPIGFLVVIIIPAVIIVYEELRKIFKEAVNLRKKKEPLLNTKDTKDTKAENL